ncbi:hypothetical protein ABZX75_08545 [Streptomyces sp. NPDC003038]|uniref:hypothetical protein n=1 Tax=unclassified Streptomyces TaxID=2593676 RepID=UPI0033A8C8A5
MTTNENILPIDGDIKPLDNHASGVEITPLDNHASGIEIKPLDSTPVVPGEEIQTLDNHASTPRP